MASGDQFVSFKAGGDRRDGSFFFYHVGYRMAEREESYLIFVNCFLSCMIIVFFHACGLSDQFVSFKADGDSRDVSFFFYHAGYLIAGRKERKKKDTKK